MDKIEILKKMCVENPENVELLYVLGLEYKEAGLVRESMAAFTDALKHAKGEMFDRIIKEIKDVGPMKAPTPEVSREQEEGNHPYNTRDEAGKLGRSEETDFIDASEKSGAYIDDNNKYDEDNQDDEDGDEIAKFRLIKGRNTEKVNNLKKDGPATVKFDDVGGLEDLKNAIRMKIIKPFLTPGLFERFKKKSGGGLLLFGPPGCGKTFIARATAGECSAVFKPVHITDVLDSYFGQSAQNVKDIFSVARSQKPCILFFDEIDTIGFNRAKTSTDMMRSVVDQLLSEIEGIDTNTERILIIGATNMPWDVDPALRRPGRFDRTIFVPPPDIAARIAIFKLKLEGRPCENIDCTALAKETELFSGADIENVIETATENVLEEILSTGTERKLHQADLLNALKSVKPTTIEWLRTIANYVKYANQSGVYNDVEAYLSRHKKFI